MQVFPSALACPLTKAPPAGQATAAAHLERKQLPRQAGAQHELDAGEDLPVAYPRATTALAELALLGQERHDHRPERVIDEGLHTRQTISRYLLKRALTLVLVDARRAHRARLLFTVAIVRVCLDAEQRLPVSASVIQGRCVRALRQRQSLDPPRTRSRSQRRLAREPTCRRALQAN